MWIFSIIGIIAAAVIVLAIGLVVLVEIVAGIHNVYCRIAEWVDYQITVPFSEKGGIIKITIENDNWESFVKATLFEFKKKYKWSKEPEWLFVTGGAAHESTDSVESWVYWWLESHPDATIENNHKRYILPNKLYREKRKTF
jgi:hypothetical protein